MSNPVVDVIIPAVDAAGTIGDAIESVKAQTYPNLGSIVVAASDEGTAEVARSHGAVVVSNPTGKTPHGLNLALAVGNGEVVARIDAHSLIPPGYLQRAVEAMERSGADNVGGMQVPVGDTFWSRAIAAAMSSVLGAGDARYRIGGEAGPTDTVYLGVFKRSTLAALGGFDETFERNQDYELNHRIREAGGIVWFEPELRVTYRPRGSLSSLARQYFDYGRWKRMFSRRHPGSLRWRQLAAPTLVTAVILSLAGSAALPVLLWLPAAYLAVLIVGGLGQWPKCGRAALGVPIAWMVMHFAWGIGFLVGPGNNR